MRKLDRNARFLSISLIVICVFCIAIFSFLAQYMGGRTQETIDSVGEIYMEGMNDRITRHFATMVDMRLNQLDTLQESIPVSRTRDNEELREWLIYNAQIRGFDSLAYFFDDGTYEMIFGEEVRLLDSEKFVSAMHNGERNICIGVNEEGAQSAVVGVPFSTKTEYNDKKCIALAAKMPVNYIRETLSLDEDDTLLYSFVIRLDGTFVVHSADAYRDNYFDRVDEVYDSVEGMTKEQFAEELKAAMAKDEDYSMIFTMNGERRQMYCSTLPMSQWYLLTFMPYGALNETVSALSAKSLMVTLGCCVIVLLLLIAVFMVYFKLNRRQLHELDEARRMAEDASRSKGEFLSNMSHDIRTPMNAIVGMTSIALSNVNNPERVQNCLRKIVLSSKHLLGLINDVLDMSKIESGKMILNVELVSLREVMDSIVSIVQPQMKAKHQRFNIFIYDISSESVICDSVRLNQVLLNLLSNAIKFTPEGGSIEVCMHEMPSPKGDEYVRIQLTVKDSGIGMSEEFQKRIFDSFTREDNKRVQKTEGTGLGMAITKYIVDAMGGTITVKSTQGIGTEFKVTLDFERSQEEQEEMILPDFTMLVVDDDQQLCESTVSSLHSIGIRAEWTLTGESAVDMVREHHARHNDYHIILLDWKLPGMDGIQTARLLRAQLGNEVPILLLSAYDCSEIEDEARAAGINGFLSKPLFKSTLYYGLKPYIGNPDEHSSAESDASASLAGHRVLMAEDNELNAEIATELLQEEGLELDWAENGQLCVDMFAQSQIGHYDAILMDIRMPVKDGFEATEEIRAMNREDASLPIIAMTADAFSEDVQKCLDHGMNAHVAKPIDVKEISRLLHRFWAAAGSAR